MLRCGSQVHDHPDGKLEGVVEGSSGGSKSWIPPTFAESANTRALNSSPPHHHHYYQRHGDRAVHSFVDADFSDLRFTLNEELQACEFDRFARARRQPMLLLLDVCEAPHIQPGTWPLVYRFKRC